MSMDDEVTRLPGGVEGGALLREGQRFDSYEVLRLLGRGGMGEVYAVRHAVLGTEHALKLIKREISAQPGARRRFQDEARAMARLVHPGIVHVDDFGETEGLTWLRMEWVGRSESGKVGKSGGGGSSLEEKLKADGGKLNEAEVRGIIGAILKALGYAHGEGLVHRDLKPANILLDADGSVKISDFGLVRMVGEQWLQSQVRESVARSISMSDRETVGPSGSSGSGATSSKALLGTYAYMSPEQKEGGEVDHRSDLYAVGLMAFQMLTGEKTPGFELPSALVDGLDPSWDDWVRNALAARPDRRFCSAEAMLEGLPAGVAAESAKATVAAEKVEPSRPAVEAKAPQRTVAVEGASSARPPSAERAAAFTALQPSTRPAAAARGGPVPGQNAEVELPSEVKMSFSWVRGMLSGGVKMAFTWVGAMNLWVGTYEVTNAEFRAFRSGHNSGNNFNGARQPVVRVSYDDAVAFCDWLTKRERSAGCLPEGYRYRLANGDEWTRFAQCGTNRTYPWGNSMPPTRGNYSNNISGYGYNSGAGRTVNVDNVGRNEWGLFGVGGNVWEWTSEQSGLSRVVRGGSWFTDGELYLRVESRYPYPPSDRDNGFGFRVLLGPAAGGG